MTKRILLTLLIAACLLIPVYVSAQDEATPEAAATATDTPPTAQPAQISVVVEQPAPTVASTDIPYLGLGFLVLAAIAVIGVVVYVVQHPTAAGLATALAEAQKNRALLDALEMRYQAIPQDAQEALRVTVTILRVIAGVIPTASMAILATIALLEDIETPGAPPEYHAQIDRNTADIAAIKDQLTEEK